MNVPNSSQNGKQRNCCISKQCKDLKIRTSKITNKTTLFDTSNRCKSSLPENVVSKRSCMSQRRAVSKTPCTTISKTSRTGPQVGKNGTLNVNRQSSVSKTGVKKVTDKELNRVNSKEVKTENAIEIGLSCNFENKTENSVKQKNISTNQSSMNGVLTAYDQSSEMNKKVRVLMRIYKTIPNKKVNVLKSEKLFVKSLCRKNCLPVENKSLECRKFPKRNNKITPISTKNCDEKPDIDNFKEVSKIEKNLPSICTETSHEPQSYSSGTRELESMISDSDFEHVAEEPLIFKLASNKCRSESNIEYRTDFTGMKNNLPKSMPSSRSLPNLKELNLATDIIIEPLMESLAERIDNFKLETISESNENNTSKVEDKTNDFNSENVIPTHPQSQLKMNELPPTTSDSDLDIDSPPFAENSHHSLPNSSNKTPFKIPFKSLCCIKSSMSSSCEHCKSFANDNQSAVTTGVLSAGEVFWIPINGSIQVEQDVVKEIDDKIVYGTKRWQERRQALCNPTEMIVSQEFREKAEHCLNIRRTRIGKKLSHFVKSAIFTNYEVDLI